MARVLVTLNNYFDDLEIGDRFETAGRTVTETDIVNFSGLSGDYSLHHTNEPFAIARGFGGRIAHGCLTLSISTGLISSMGQTMDKVVAFYGMDKVRFLKPVRIGDTLHVEGEIIVLLDKGEKGGVVTRRDSIKNQNGDIVATLDKSTLNLKRPVSAAALA
ncbi:MaoC/PaaZ C-terminal domain-containing protein [Microvirga antarctica]|uniref:MaoC/PaaZ C-terminal domain-containing protein n=1 Tax=Microvirga antarctica TaxID=2819233 RepID=UPI001B306C34|nr:MaoC/PaaZ C-terminal domain-containing protein [Microvirga antarctica]